MTCEGLIRGMQSWRLASRFARTLAYGCALATLFLAGGQPGRADDLAARRQSVREQFARAEGLRVALEAKPERQRSLQEYTEVVTSYRRVYLITPNAAEVPVAIKQVADLYNHMGEQFDQKYFRSALDAYHFLVHDYPASPDVPDAQLAIAALQRGPLSQPEPAKQTYEDFLRDNPRSARAAEARAALAEMAEAAKRPARSPAASASKAPAESSAPAASTAAAAADSSDSASGSVAELGQVRVWNADTYTRIVIDLGGQASYQAARISGPDRIYFDIENAHLNPRLAAEPVEIPSNGYLKAVRIAQNRANVVRVVLEVNKVKDYSVFELANPDRLVVDVYGSEQEGRAPATITVVPTTPTAPTAKPAPELKTVAATKASKSPAKAAPLAAAVKPPTRPVKREKPAEEPPLLSPREAVAAMGPAPVAQPTRAGERSLSRVLGLKIGRIVIDPGHGGHDTGTIGPTGLMEKDLCLDVALRLGRLIQEQLPLAEVTYTRKDDSYVPLEKRTEIANEARADLLISIHANSSDNHRVRGIETYYLNFNAAPEAMEVAARENATAQGGVHQLEELVQKIARNDKIEESRDLAESIQDSLTQQTRSGARDRGVRQAPFVVLIGAHMPSVLTEISFLSNPTDEKWLKKPASRQRIAEGIYHGIESYLKSTNSLAGNLRSAGPGASGPSNQSNQPNAN
jgi:N-acetylmuramoyl-L-alanine amidase